MASLSTLQTINVDLLDVVMETLYANQDESGTRTAQCCVRLQGVDWNVPSDVSVFLKMHKPNHFNIYQQIGVDGFGSSFGFSVEPEDLFISYLEISTYMIFLSSGLDVY